MGGIPNSSRVSSGKLAQSDLQMGGIPNSSSELVDHSNRSTNRITALLRFPEDFNISSMEGIDRTNILEVGNEGVHFGQTNVHNSQQSNQRYHRGNQQGQRRQSMNSSQRA
ncbi:uncharacterized protein [Pyrus communis]|uniref:uncharacterized protein isoform X1 n=1 Tax=Pyrus communis TaxID=23211 RepID=UPI0035C25044